MDFDFFTFRMISGQSSAFCRRINYKSHKTFTSFISFHLRLFASFASFAFDLYPTNNQTNKAKYTFAEFTRAESPFYLSPIPKGWGINPHPCFLRAVSLN